jgi:hypothetical protein
MRPTPINNSINPIPFINILSFSPGQKPAVDFFQAATDALTGTTI